MSTFFIDRPKFAFVISIVLTLAGLIALSQLPIAEFPEISPPQVQVTASYPGANAEVVEESVAAPIEAEVNGVDNMLYMSSTSGNDGTYTLRVTFEVGTDPDIAAVEVQNRVALATPLLPEDVTRQGVSVRKQSTNLLMVVTVFSPEDSFDSIFLSNYASINIRDTIVRVNGVGEAEIFGAQDYGMRIWLSPDRLTSLNLTTGDVIQAIRAQNLQVAPGAVGAPPAPSDQQFQFTIRAEGRLSEASTFSDIVVRANPDGSFVRLSDVARIELGSQSYSAEGAYNGSEAAVMGIYQSPGANALGVAERVRAELQRLSERFPEDLAYEVTYDTTLFVSTTIDEVVTTLFVAFVLVVLVVFVFLGDWRSALIPTLAIPVSLIGTFALLLALGFTLNTISLFALILAIGLVVDDAIVVVENVQRLMADEGLSTRDATRKAMGQVTGPVIATTLVLLAVFVPTGFLPGLTGRLYQQFAVTISVAVVISSINALTLSPALCATLLKPPSGKPPVLPLRLFERGLAKTRDGYVRVTGALVRRSALAVILIGAAGGATYHFATTVPTGFIPLEDRGAFFIDASLPSGASVARTDAVVGQIETILEETAGIQDVISVTGYSLLSGVGSNSALIIAVLEPWDDRDPETENLFVIQGSVQQRLFAIPEANIFAFIPPPIPGLGTTGGVQMELQAVGGQSPTDLASVAGAFTFAANQDPAIASAFTTFTADLPQLGLTVDRDRVHALGVALPDLFDTLQATTGSYYVNDFNLFGRVYRVMVQADTDYRADSVDIMRLHVRNNDGEMIPLRTLVDLDLVLGPQSITRYNMFRSATINASAAPGFSSGQTIAALNGTAGGSLPDGYAYEWTGSAQQELEAGAQAALIFGLSLLFAYLFLVAQYESWTNPISVMLSVIVAILGAFAGIALVGLANNIYAQVGFVMLIGLAAKNAILIVEFARELRANGMAIAEAATTAARQRFRAVMMTAISFLLGIFPLVVATGAGAMSRISIGVTVFSGMLAATAIGIFLIPALYAAIQSLREAVRRLTGRRVDPDADSAPPPQTAGVAAD